MKLLALLSLVPCLVSCLVSCDPAAAPTTAVLRLQSVAGEPIAPLETIGRAEGPKFGAFIFTHTDCPVANRYAPELGRIDTEYTPQGVAFHLVYVDPELTAAQILEHREAYGYSMAAVRDDYHDLAKLAGALVTPEIAIFGPDRKLLYCGRIDDRYDDFGKARAEASRRDARLALDAALAGRPIESIRTKAVGCYIADIDTAGANDGESP